MKHIAIDARESGTSTGRYIDKLVEYLHTLHIDSTYRVTLLAKPHRLEFYMSLAPRFTAVACPHKEFTFAEQLAFKAQLDGLKPDLVHFPAVQQPVLYKGTVVTTIQDLTTLRFRNPAKNRLVFKLKQQVYRRVNQRVINTSALLLTASEFVKQDVIAFSSVDPAKVTVTHESADDLPTPAEPLAAGFGLTDETRFIMYVGRPTPHKNLERLIQAFATLQKQQQDQTDQPGFNSLELVLAGKKDANYDRIEHDVQKQGIANVTFTGFVSDQQLRWLYEHCQAYVFPSLSEGFGLPGLEAMRHGAPVVSSNATCLPEIYGDAALYFDPLSTQDMADKIATMLTDDDLRETFITKGYVQAGRYSWQRMAEQTLAVYNSALSL